MTGSLIGSTLCTSGPGSDGSDLIRKQLGVWRGFGNGFVLPASAIPALAAAREHERMRLHNDPDAYAPKRLRGGETE